VTAPKFRVGIDVGSTTVKAVVVDAQSDEVLWKDYRRTRRVRSRLCWIFCSGWRRRSALHRTTAACS